MRRSFSSSLSPTPATGKLAPVGAKPGAGESGHHTTGNQPSKAARNTCFCESGGDDFQTCEWRCRALNSVRSKVKVLENNKLCVTNNHVAGSHLFVAPGLFSRCLTSLLLISLWGIVF